MKKELVLLGLLLVGCLPTNIPTQENNTNNQAKENESKNEEVKQQESNSPVPKNEIVSKEKTNTEIKKDSTVPKPINTPISLPSYSPGPLVVDNPECIKEEYSDLPNDKCKVVQPTGYTNIPHDGTIPAGRPTLYDAETCTYFRNDPILELSEKEVISGRYFIELWFKDESKIRWNEEKKEFYSLNCDDVSNINKIMKNNNYRLGFVKPIEEDEKLYREAELRKEKNSSYDVPNAYSKYIFTKFDTNYKEFIEEFRKDPNVRLMNLIKEEFGTTS